MRHGTPHAHNLLCFVCNGFTEARAVVQFLIYCILYSSMDLPTSLHMKYVESCV